MTPPGDVRRRRGRGGIYHFAWQSGKCRPDPARAPRGVVGAEGALLCEEAGFLADPQAGNREPGTTRVPGRWPGEVPGVSAPRSVASLLHLDYNQAGTRNLKPLSFIVPAAPLSLKDEDR